MPSASNMMSSKGCFTGQHTVPHDLRYNTQEKHMMEVAWTILELLSMFDGRCLQAGLVTKQGIQAGYSVHFDTPWGDSLTFRWSSYGNTIATKIDVVRLKSVRLEARGCSQLLHYYSPRQGEVLNSKYGWCVISSRLNFNTIVLQLHTQVDHKVGTILSKSSSICPSALCYFHVGKRSISGAPAIHFS